MCERCDWFAEQADDVMALVPLLTLKECAPEDVENARERLPETFDRDEDCENLPFVIQIVISRLASMLELCTGRPDFISLGEIAGLMFQTRVAVAVERMGDQASMTREVLGDIKNLPEFQKNRHSDI